MQAKAGSSYPANAAASGPSTAFISIAFKSLISLSANVLKAQKEILHIFSFILRLALQYSPFWLTEFRVKTHS